MPYTKTVWQNEPSTATPTNATNLNKLETQYEQSLADGKLYTDGKITTANAAIAAGISESKAYTDTKVSSLPTTTYVDNKVAGAAKGKATANYQLIGGTIRYIDASTWGFVSDANHAPTGLASVTYMADRLRVNFDFTASKVSTFIASPDETIGSVNGIRLGSSVGLSFADIFIYTSTSSTPINPNTLSNPSGNIWLYGLMEVA